MQRLATACVNLIGGVDGRSARCYAARLLSLVAICAVFVALPPAAHAQLTCSSTDATAAWTTAADWSSCNSTFPNNGQPASADTYDATISTGDPTLTTTITIGSVTITSPGAWTINGPGGSAKCYRKCYQ